MAFPAKGGVSVSLSAVWFLRMGEASLPARMKEKVMQVPATLFTMILSDIVCVCVCMIAKNKNTTEIVWVLECMYMCAL